MLRDFATFMDEMRLAAIMPDWSLIGDTARTEVAGISSARGTSVTSGGSANTKGASWTVIITSTAFDAERVFVYLTEQTAGTDALTDIAIGGSGAEQIILANLTSSTGTGTQTRGAIYDFPIAIPAGTRITAKTQNTTLSSVVRVALLLLDSGFWNDQPLGRVTTYGAATADSGGVSVDPGAVAGTKGAWSVIDASTANPIKGFVLALGNQVNTVRTTYTWLIDVGVGASTQEVVVIGDLMATAASTEDSMVPIAFPFIPCNIPAGSRLVVRASCQNTDATDRLFDAIIYGVD